MNGCCAKELSVALPVATQLVALAHDTLVSVLFVSSDGFTLAMIDQLVPFHRSANVRLWPSTLVASPTARQVAALTHDTLDNELFSFPG
jgi:hypothetical protein